MSIRTKTAKAQYDIVVIGGGLSGMCAAISAARHGAKTALIHGRHVFGGNASSEIRMHVCGACMKETSLVFLSHLGHNVNATHVALEQEASQYQMRIAYDGLQVSM